MPREPSEKSLEGALRRYIEATGRGRDVALVSRLSGGWSVSTFHIKIDGRDLVLRIAGQEHPLQTNAAREAHLIQRAATVGVPVPTVFCAEEDTSWLDAPFSLSTFVGGQAPNVWSRRAMSSLLGAVSAERLLRQTVDLALQIQSIPVEDGTLEFASSLGVHAAQYDIASDVARWREMLDSASVRRRPALEAAGRWLAENAPPDGRVVFQHHDFRLGNMLFGPDGSAAAVLDWEFAGAGDPLCDIAYAAQPYCLGRLLSTRSSLELDPDPTAWLLREYAERSNETIERGRLEFFVALGIFKMAIALVVPADRWWQGSRDPHDGWLELPILSLSEDLILMIRETL